MVRRKGFELIVFIAILVSFGAGQTFAQSLPAINQNVVIEYAQELLKIYNVQVINHYGYNLNSTISKCFPLYEATGYSFNVTVMWASNDSTRYIGFVFVPILASSLNIVVNNDSTIAYYEASILNPPISEHFNSSEFNEMVFSNDYIYSHFVADNSYGFFLRQGSGNQLFNGSSIVTGLSPFIWFANASALFADPIDNSEAAALWLFHNNQNTIPKPSTPNPVIAFITNPVFLAIIAIISLAIGILAVIPRRKSQHSKKKSGRS